MYEQGEDKLGFHHGEVAANTLALAGAEGGPGVFWLLGQPFGPEALRIKAFGVGPEISAMMNAIDKVDDRRTSGDGITIDFISRQGAAR